MKTRNSVPILIMVAGMLATLLVVGCSSIQDRHVYARTDQTRDSMTQVTEGYDTFGRKWGQPAPVMAVKEQPAPAIPPAAPKVATSRTPDFSSVDLKTGLVNLTKRVPAAVAVGQQYSYDLTATAVEEAGQIIVTDTIPEGTTYIKSDPEASREGNMLTWRLPATQKGMAQNIKVWLKADREGDLAGCATVAAVPRGCASTFAGKPLLAIHKTGPETALLGSNVVYNMVVKNTGTFAARNVVVTDPVPEGLSHSSGQSTLTWNLGDLAPAESKNLSATFRAAKRGRVCNAVVADSSNAGKVQAEACTVIQQPGIQLVKTGDKEQYLNLEANYRIVVSNTGDTTLSGVVVTDTAPAATRIISASGGSVTGNSAAWNIGELRTGQSRSMDLKLTSNQPGRHCNSVTVATATGLRDSAEACTVWQGIPAILIEVVDNPDPIRIGRNTTYTIRVTNQGTADDTSVSIVVELPRELTPVAAPGGSMRDNTVVFPAVARLAPQQAITYTVEAKGAQAGDARISVKLNSDHLSTPVVEQESTTVY